MFVDKYLSADQEQKIYFSALYYLAVAGVHGWGDFIYLYSNIYGEFYISTKIYLWVSFELFCWGDDGAFEHRYI